MKRPTNLNSLRPSRKLFSTNTTEPLRRHVQDWAIAVMALVAYFVIVNYCQ